MSVVCVVSVMRVVCVVCVVCAVCVMGVVCVVRVVTVITVGIIMLVVFCYCVCRYFRGSSVSCLKVGSRGCWVSSKSMGSFVVVVVVESGPENRSGKRRPICRGLCRYRTVRLLPVCEE